MLCRGVLEGGGATGLLNKGGGEQQASWFSKQQAAEIPQVLTSLHNSVFTHGTLTKDANCVSQSKGWAKLTPIQSLLTLSTPLWAPARMFPQ